MRITSLSVKNFRCFEEASLSFTKPVTAIVGPNGRGKSTLLDALRWAMTGVCRGTDAGGKGAEALVRHGADPASMEVTVGLEHGSFTRKVGDGARSKLSQTLASKHGIHPTAALVCLSWDAFIKMEPHMALDTLLSALRVEVDAAVVKELAGEDYGEIAHLKFSDPKSLREAHEWAYRQRTDLGRDIKRYGDSPLPDLGQYPERFRAWSIEEARARRGEAQELLAAVRSEMEIAVAKAAVLRSDSRGALEARISTLKNETRQLSTARAALSDTPMPSLPSLEKALKKAITGHGEAVGRVKKLEEERSTAAAELKAVRGRLEALGGDLDDKAKAACPTCRRALSADAWRKLVTSLQTEDQALSAKVLEVTQQVVEAQKHEASLNPDPHVRALDRAQDYIRERARDLERMTGRLHDLGEELARQESQLAAIQASPEQPTLEEQPEEDPATAALRERVKRGELVIAQIGAYIADRGTVDAQAKARSEAKARYERLDRLCGLLASKGPVAAKCISGKLDGFRDDLNAALGYFHYEIDLQLEPTFQVRVRPQDEDWTAVTLLSDSEQVRLGLAVQLAFAGRSGLLVATPDEISRLDAEASIEFLDLIEDARQNAGTQVIFAGSVLRPMDEYSPPEIPGWEYVVLE